MIFFTGDTHFGHKGVIRYAHRPFASVEEMDAALIAKWNALVHPNDTVYHIGDVALCRPEHAVESVRQLHGHKVLIVGNHDAPLFKKKSAGFLDLFESVQRFLEIKVPDPDAYQGFQRIVLCHYAMRVWNKSHYGAWQLYGHSHGSLADDPHARSLDVGVDCWDYAPVSYERVKKKMLLKDWRPVDRHGVHRENEEIPHGEEEEHA